MDGSLAPAHPLDRVGLSVHDRPLGAQGDLVLGLADLRTVVGVPGVRVGDRLPLEADLLVGDRHGDLLLLGHHILTQPRLTGFLSTGASDQPLL